MILIKLSTFADREVWVNPQYIASMVRSESGANVFIANDSDPIRVKETPEDIMQLIIDSVQ